MVVVVVVVVVVPSQVGVEYDEVVAYDQIPDDSPFALIE